MTTLKILTAGYDALTHALTSFAGCRYDEVTARVSALTAIDTRAIALRQLVDAGVRRSTSARRMVDLAENLMDKAADVAYGDTQTTDHNAWA